MEQHRVVAATDASMGGRFLATHWIVTTLENDEEIVGGARDD